MDNTTDQFDDDVNARLEEPTQTGKEVVQGEGADVEMNEAQQGNEKLETTQEQVVDDAHVTITTVTKKTEVPATSYSCSTDLASKFLNYSDIPHTDAEIVSPLDVYILPNEVSNFAPPMIEELTKESRDEVNLAKVSSQPHSTYEAASKLTEFELKKILIDKLEKSKSYLAAPEHRDCYDSLKKSYDLDKDFFFSYDVYSLKRGRKDKDKDEDPSAGSDRGLKKRKTSKDAEPTTGPKNKDSLTSSPIDFSGYILNGLKIKNLTQEILLGPAFRLLKGARSNYAKLEYDFEECYKALSKKLDWENPEGGDYPFDLSKPLSLITQYDFKECYKAFSEKLDWENPEGGDYPFDLSKPLHLITHRNHQRVPFEFFINNDLKYLQGGVSTMTYTTSTTKSKAAKYALWGILHWRQQRKSFYSFARGMQSRGDVYSTKHILAVTHVKVMRKHRYGHLEEIVVRRADNILYRFKEGYFQRLRINDIVDMLILVVQNQLINLSWDDVADFTIALMMFTRRLVIQKRVKDLQLGVKSYQKKDHVTPSRYYKTVSEKGAPYNSAFKDLQGFIYVDDYKRNRLMRSDDLYKFSDGTLTRLISSLEDITKNIDMEYLPEDGKWSNLEKKRAHFMIKDINKLLKERRMMRSLEKFVGGRLYGTDLRLLQRTI
ncbi:hypothetical protein Tco_1184533 [Tanacetum coccineum]